MEPTTNLSNIERCRILVMTVGTGVGPDKEKKVRSLAHGLLQSIKHYNPNQIIYFGSKESKETMDMVETIAKEQQICLPSVKKRIILEDIDHFDKCMKQMQDEIEDLRNELNNPEIIMDYTSGTKTMTAAIVVLSILYHLKLSLISGKRSSDSVVQSGTENIQTQNPYRAYDKLLIGKLVEAINYYRFNTARQYLNQIVDLPSEKKEYYEHIIEGYDAWDKFDHKRAFDELWKITRDQDPDGLFNANKEFLGKLLKIEDPASKSEFYVADLVNNAKRRFEEEKYDDAVARLYRTIELIEQYLLKRLYNIQTDRVDLNILSEKGVSQKYIEELKALQDDRGQIKIGLKRGYEILEKLGNKIGKRYMEDSRLQDLLRKRNESILAHGTKPVTKEDCEALKSAIEEYVAAAFSDANKYINSSCFVKMRTE